MIKKISFIAVVLMLAIFIDGCASIGYARTSYNNQSFRGLKLGMPVPLYTENNSSLVANVDVTIYNSETPNPINSKTQDNMVNMVIGLQYHQLLLPPYFGVYGGLGYNGANYYPAVGSARITGNGLAYEGGVDIYQVLHLGYRVSPLGNTTINEMFVELGLPVTY